MTQDSQSRKGAVKPNSLLSPKKILRVGTWNTRTMYEAGKTTQVAMEMQNYNIAILGLSETRWTSSGQVKVPTGETVLYSGHPEGDAPHTEGVGLMLTKEAQKALLSWEAISSRLITATFRTKHRKIHMNIIQCYAPTNDKDEEIKEDFYQRLQTIIDRFSQKDLTILMGDFNAKVGDNNSGHEEVMGKHGLGEMNENGEFFTELCSANKMVIGGTIYPHKRIHKAMWVSPDHTTENQIDHLCILKRFRRSLIDVRVMRGADAASDHHLVLAKIKLKLKKNTNPSNPQVRYNIEYLKDENT